MRSLISLFTLLAFSQLSFSAVLAPDPRHHQLSTGHPQHSEQPLRHANQKQAPLRAPSDTFLAEHHDTHQQPLRFVGEKSQDNAQQSHLNKRSDTLQNEQLYEGSDNDVDTPSRNTKREKWQYDRCSSIEGLGLAACTSTYSPLHYPGIIGRNATAEAISILLDRVLSQYKRPGVNDPFYCIETPTRTDMPAAVSPSYKLCVNWTGDKKFDRLSPEAHRLIKEYMFNQCINEHGQFESSHFRIRLGNGPYYSEICFTNQGRKNCHRDIYMCEDVAKLDQNRKYHGPAIEQKYAVPDTHPGYHLWDEELTNIMDTVMAKYGGDKKSE